LGFGVVACVLLAATERNPRLRLLEIGLSVWLFGAAILTFSRGGVANVVVALLLALVMMAGRGRNVTRLAFVAVAVVVAVGLLLPLLNDFTGGHLLTRYQYTSSSRRDLIVKDDLHQFREHPLIGVGIGVSPENRPPKIVNQEAHTEFTRLLAEQGVLGIVAIVALVVMVLGAFRRAERGLPRALVAAFVAWSFTEMTHSATRLAFTSFAIGAAVLAAGLVVTTPASPES
jgi:O-antigen ligase